MSTDPIADNEAQEKEASVAGGRRWPRRIAIGLAVVYVLYVAFGFLVLPGIVASQLTGVLTDLTGRTPTVGTVRFNPFGLRLEIEDFSIPDADGERMVGFDAFAVDLQISSILHRAPVLSEVALVRPFVRLEVDPQGRLNVLDLVPESPEEEPVPEEEAAADEGGLPRFRVDRLRLAEGEIDLVDRSQTPPFDLALIPLSVTIENLSTLSGERVDYDFSLDEEEGARLRWVGELTLDPVGLEAEIGISEVSLPKLWEYFGDEYGVDVTDGRFEMKAKVGVELSDGVSVTVEDASSRVNGLRVLDRRTSEEVVVLSQIGVDDVDVQFSRQGDAPPVTSIEVGRVTAAGTRIEVRLDEQGELNLAGLGPPAIEAEAEVESLAEEADATGGSVAYHVGEIELRDWVVNVSDRSANPPAALKLAPIGLRVKDFQSAPGSRAGFDLDVGVADKVDALSLSGDLGISPLAAKVDVVLRGLPLSAFQSWVDRFAALEIVRGAVSTRTEVVYAGESAGGSGGEGPALRVAGGLSIDDLVTLDRAASDPFVSWKQVGLTGFVYEQAPDRISLDELDLEGVKTAFILRSDGGSNLDAILAPGAASDEGEPAPAAEPASEGEGGGPPIRVGRVALKDVGFVFRDEGMEPDFEIALSELAGEVVGLSSQKGQKAKVELGAKLGAGARFDLRGALDPLGDATNLDLALIVSNAQMTTFSPYSARYAGYAIDKGRLDLELDYSLDEGRLRGENKLGLDQFEFGSRVDSPDATSLPVPLAVALMRSPSGRIDIDLPVSGRIDDPAFDLGGLILKAFTNLITKAVSSPFVLLGDLAGFSGEDLSQIEFEPGQAIAAPGQEAKLDALAKALEARPTLRLEVRGQWHEKRDPPALQRALVEADVRRLEFQSLRSSERAALGSPEAVRVSDEDRLEWLGKLYRERLKENPNAVWRDVPELDPAVVGDAVAQERRIARLVERLAPTYAADEDALRDLALARAERAIALLTAEGRITPDRVLRSAVQRTKAKGDTVPTLLTLAAR